MRQVARRSLKFTASTRSGRLFDTGAHPHALDAFGGTTEAAEDVATFYRGWKDAERCLKKHREKVEAAAREADYLRSPSRNSRRFRHATAKRRNSPRAGPA